MAVGCQPQRAPCHPSILQDTEQSQPLMLVENETELQPGLAEEVHTDHGQQLATASSSSSGPPG